MSYMSVKEETSDNLVLSRSPNFMSWTVLCCSIVCAIGAGYYSGSILMHCIYLAVAVFLGISYMSDWEICSFHKKEGSVKLKRFNLIQKILHPFSEQPVLTSPLNDVIGVTVNSIKNPHHGDGHRVMLKLVGGIALGITETHTYGSRSDHEAVCAKIQSFLDLEHQSCLGDVDNDLGLESEVSSSSDADFERITDEVLFEDST